MDSYLGKQTDPLSLNRYTYYSNEPIGYYDPSAKDINRQMHITAKNKKGNSYVFREGIDFGIRNNTAYSTFNKKGSIVAPPNPDKVIWNMMNNIGESPMSDAASAVLYWRDEIHLNKQTPAQINSVISEGEKSGKYVLRDMMLSGLLPEMASSTGKALFITKVAKENRKWYMRRVLLNDHLTRVQL